MSGSGDRVRLAIVGAGNIAPLNARGYLHHDRCDVIAICDPLEDKARALAESWGVPKVFSDLDKCLADPDIDAVEILTPTHLHHEHVVASLEAGKHVSCQKPVSNTVDQALEMAATAEKQGVNLRISECFRHYPPLEKAKELVSQGAIGHPTNLRIRTVVGQTDSAFQAALQAEGYIWRLNALSPGGHLFDDMVHKYAMALWLAGQDIVSVQAVVRRRDLFFEPCACIFEYEDPQLLGSMEVSYAPSMMMRSSYYGADEFFEIQGDEGFLWVTRCTGELLDLPPLMLYQGVGKAGNLHEVPGLNSDWGAGFDRSAAHFVDSLLAGTTPEMSAAEATKVLQLCFAVYEAGNTGSKVDPRTITGSVTPEGWAEW
ncbi:MAG TPA: Gfo/Idh/MocA family oxidoreductase [Acidimicrobiales bacterium]|nr:Gfo/Idh/MocA family oxidoreductase [Acidimicrobiales bacterium]